MHIGELGQCTRHAVLQPKIARARTFQQRQGAWIAITDRSVPRAILSVDRTPCVDWRALRLPHFVLPTRMHTSTQASTRTQLLCYLSPIFTHDPFHAFPLAAIACRITTTTNRNNSLSKDGKGSWSGRAAV